jgi:hypothetical protein
LIRAGYSKKFKLKNVKTCCSGSYSFWRNADSSLLIYSLSLKIKKILEKFFFVFKRGQIYLIFFVKDERGGGELQGFLEQQILISHVDPSVLVVVDVFPASSGGCW